jgi:Flp pilus assembly protein TadB
MLLAANQVAGWIGGVLIGGSIIAFAYVSRRKNAARLKQQRDDDYARKLQQQGVERVVVGKPLPPHVPPRPPVTMTRGLLAKLSAMVILSFVLVVVLIVIVLSKHNGHTPLWVQWLTFLCFVGIVGISVSGFIRRRQVKRRTEQKDSKLSRG